MFALANDPANDVTDGTVALATGGTTTGSCVAEGTAMDPCTDIPGDTHSTKWTFTATACKFYYSIMICVSNK